MSESRVRIGLVGCGGIAQAHLNGYGQLVDSGCSHFEITALCDSVGESRQSCANTLAEFQAAAPAQFESATELIEAGVVDGVDVCTPHGDHHSTAIACLDAGLHVMVEKPLGVSIRAARQVVEASERSGKVLSVAENARRGLGQRAMAWMFNKNQLIGSPRMFVIECMRGPELPRQQSGEQVESEPADEVNWRRLTKLCGGGWTFDGGVFRRRRHRLRGSAQGRSGIDAAEGWHECASR